MAPRGVGVVLSVMVVGYLMKHFDSRPLMAFGMVLAAYSTWLMAGYTSSVTPMDLVFVNFIQGIGWSFLFVPLTAATFSTLNPRHMDVAAGLYGLVGNFEYKGYVQHSRCFCQAYSVGRRNFVAIS